MSLFYGKLTFCVSEVRISSVGIANLVMMLRSCSTVLGRRDSSFASGAGQAWTSRIIVDVRVRRSGRCPRTQSWVLNVWWVLLCDSAQRRNDIVMLSSAEMHGRPATSRFTCVRWWGRMRTEKWYDPATKSTSYILQLFATIVSLHWYTDDEAKWK